jgi:hypothetical protein
MVLSKYFDRIAIALSTICIVHCLAMPFVIAMMPMAALALGGDGHFHAFLLWFVVPTSVLGLGFGFKVHQRFGVIAVGAAAIAALAVTALYAHDVWDPSVETLANVAASVALAAAHWRNFREVRRAHHHH